MKRSPGRTASSSRYNRIKDNLSTEQFAGVGSFILLFNEIEGVIKSFLADQLDLRGNFRRDLVSRLSGLPAVMELIKLHAEHTIPDVAGLPNGEVTLMVDSCKPVLIEVLTNTLNAAAELKGYRDTIAHATVLDREAAIGIGGGGKKKTYEVLLAAKALDGLFERAEALNIELQTVKNVVIWSYQSTCLFVADPNGKKFKVQFTPEVQAMLDHALEQQRNRLSLAPLPAFRL